MTATATATATTRASSPLAPAPTAPVPEPPAVPRAPDGPGARMVSSVLLPLLLLAGVLLTVARFLVFEPVNGYLAVDLAWTTAGWIAQVLLPLLIALGALLARPGSPAAAAISAGVALGVLLSVTGQLSMSAAVLLDPDVDYGLGPAWWLILVAALVLAGAVAVALTSPTLHARSRVRRRSSSAWGAALVVVAGVGWLLVAPVSSDFGWFLYLRIAGLLLTVACLAVAVLDLGLEQRLFGVAAVTTTSLWLVTVGVEFLILQPDGSRPGPMLASLGLAVLPVAGAFLAQGRPGRRTEPAVGSGRR